MSEFPAFILPVMTALVGMLIFSQAILLCGLIGFDASFILAWLANLWGVIEFGIFVIGFFSASKTMRLSSAHFWLLLLFPLACTWWVFGRLSTLEGTLEYDANVFWVFKAKILYLEQGKNLIHVLRDINFG